MSTGRSKELAAVQRLMKKFSVDELSWVIKKSLCLITWQEVIGEIARLKLALRITDIADVATKLFTLAKPTKEQLKDAILLLQFFDVVEHHKIGWKCAQLVDRVDCGDDLVAAFVNNNDDDDDDDNELLNTIAKNILRAYRTVALNAEVFPMESNGALWLMIVEKQLTKKSGVKAMNPTFFALSPALHLAGTPHLFYTGIRSKQSLPILVKGLGYEDYKSVPLEGTNVVGMFQMLTKKYTRQPSLQQIEQVIEYKPVVLCEDSKLAVREYREEYARSILKSCCYSLRNLIIESKCRWRGDRVFPLVIDNDDDDDSSGTTGRKKQAPPILVSMGIVSKDRRCSVEDILRQMIVTGVMASPVPAYVHRFVASPPINGRIKIRDLDEDTENSPPSD